MKNFNLAFIIFILVFQNANARDTVYFKDGNPLSRAFVLWRVQFKPYETSGFEVKIDSVLRGNFFTSEKWKLDSFFSARLDFDVKMNTNYLVLVKAVRLTGKNFLPIMKNGRDIFLDTPENRKELSKKWDSTTFIYKFPELKDPNEPKKGNFEVEM